jgi:gliding motility-associated-like protein
VEYLDNPNGCDTVITTTITLLPSDTTLLFSNSCQFSQTGVFTQVLSNQQGCDSLVITNVTWMPPADTTFIHQTSCDSSQLGVSQQILAAIDGCDSLVITSVTYATVDTTYSFDTSCDSSQIGVTQQLYTDPQDCDSLVITTITASVPDTTYALATSCDSASLGVFEEHFISQAGCDSTVFTTITYSASDSTFIQSVSCDPDDVGVFIDTFTNQTGCDSVVTTEVAYAISHYINLSASSCDPADTGIFTLTLVNQYGCDSIVTTMVELLPSDETFLSSTTCRSSEAGTFITAHQNQYGCDSIVTLTVLLIPADTTTIAKQTCDPAEAGMIQNTFINQDGCDSLVIEETTLYPLPELQIETSDYNGYAISCFGENDGSANADATGIPPWTYLWSTGSDNQTVTGLSAGSYAVTVTDGNGCTTSGEVMLFEPEEFSISLIVSQPDCFDHQQGSIMVEQSGGIAPIRYSIDEVNYQSSPVFNGLSGGTYTVSAIDANDCEVKEILWINVPLMVSVELGDDQQVFPGDSVIIHAIVNVPYDSLASVSWTGLNNPVCPTCLSQPVAPIITTTYSVTVTSLDGCSDEDALTLFVENDNDVYVPNVFSPDGDGVNDEIIIYAGSSVEEVLEFVVFDRWGNVVHVDDHFKANDLSHAWDGMRKQKKLNPGVFAYKVIVQFADGRQDVMYGDITLLK